MYKITYYFSYIELGFLKGNKKRVTHTFIFIDILLNS